MNLKNFAINEVAIYEPTIVGDIIKMELTHTSGNNTITFYPYVLTVYPTYFTARIECVVAASEEDLNNGKIYLLDGSGYYDYRILKNDVEFESGQFYIQPQQQVSIVTAPYFGKDGTSGISGTSGLSGTSGADGVDGIDGVNGLDGTSGINGIDGNDGLDGTSGINGLPGSDGANGTSGI